MGVAVIDFVDSLEIDGEQLRLLAVQEIEGDVPVILRAGYDAHERGQRLGVLPFLPLPGPGRQRSAQLPPGNGKHAREVGGRDVFLPAEGAANLLQVAFRKSLSLTWVCPIQEGKGRI